MAAPGPSLVGGEIDDFYSRVAIVRSSDNRVIDIVMSGGAVFTDAYSVPVIAVPVLVGEACAIFWLYDNLVPPGSPDRFYSDGANYEEFLTAPMTVFPGSIAVGNNPPISDRGYHIQFPDGTTQDSAVNRTRLTTFTALQEFAAGISSGQILTIDPTDGVGLIAAKAMSGGNSRIGGVRLGYADGTAIYNTLLHNSSGTFTIYNGFSSTGSNLLNISSTVMNVNVPVSGMTFTGNVVGPNLVNSVNGLTGIVGITAGTNITITQSGNTLTISSTASGGGSGFTYTTSAPGSPAIGDRWIDSDTGKEYVYINDGTSSQWIEPVSSNGLVGVTYTSSTNLLQFGGTGSFVKLGVGTTAPANTLDVVGLVSATSTTNTIDIIASTDGAGLRIAQATSGGSSRIGAIRLGRGTNSLSNTYLENSIGTFTIYNGVGNTGTNMFQLSTAGAVFGVPISGGITCGVVASDGGYRITSNAINAQTGVTYTLLTSDNGKIITMNNGSSTTVTIPSGLPIGYNTTVIQLGTGQVGFTSSGTTINSSENKLNIANRYSAANIISYTTDTFILAGGLTG